AFCSVAHSRIVIQVALPTPTRASCTRGGRYMVKWIVPIMLVAAFACERRTQEEGTGTEGAVGAEREPGMQPPAQQQPDQQGQQPGQGQQQPGQQPMGQEQAASEQDRQVMQNIRQALQDADLSETAKKNVQV